MTVYLDVSRPKIPDAFMLIDERDIDRVNELSGGRRIYAVHTGPNNRCMYAMVVVHGKPQYIHRLVTRAVNGQVVDHINGDGLDNRRCNLRIVTPSQNHQNRKVKRTSTTGIKGVELRPSGKYRVNITVNGKRKHLGLFKTIAEAMAVRKNAECELFGSYAGNGTEGVTL